MSGPGRLHKSNARGAGSSLCILGSWTQQTPLLFASGYAHWVGDPDRADSRAERKKTFYSSATAAVSEASHNGNLFTDSTASVADDSGSSILQGF